MKFKTLIQTVTILFCGLFVFGQQKGEIAGAWSGWVKTSDKKITYEVVISDSSGFYSGYSKIIFKVKGEELSAIKSLSIKQDEQDPEKYFLEEEKLITDNFQDDAPKKIKQVNTVFFTRQNKKLVLEGTFKTKATMGIRAATGDVYLEKNILPDSSVLFSELTKLDMAKDLSFVKNPPPVIKPPVVDTPVVAVVSKKPDTSSTIATATIAQAPLRKPVVVSTPPPAPRPVVVKPAPVVATAPAVKPSAPPVVIAPKPVPPPVKRTEPVVAAGSASDLGKRNIETIQTIYFTSDSLKLTLYDNGEVDGDTVSVVVNGKVFMGKKGLSTTPISETYYMSEETGDSIQMIMYAENLGNIAPNTGLLIVQDGKDRYEVRFSGDLTKNAAIIFKRKRE